MKRTIVIDSVTLFLHFMGPNKQLQIVLRQEGGRVVRAEAEAYAALGRGATFLGVRVCKKWNSKEKIMICCPTSTFDQIILKQYTAVVAAPSVTQVCGNQFGSVIFVRDSRNFLP